MRYLGIDYGSKRIGLALSDEQGQMGFPHSIMANTSNATRAPGELNAVDEIAALVALEKVGAIVMGESRDFSGAENPVAAEAKEFASALSSRTGIAVAWEPEFLTSVQARRAPGAPDEKQGRAPKSSAHIDDSAAALILTSYLSHSHD